MKSVLVVLAITIGIAQGAFCPGERRKGKRCLAKDKTYKCGVFLEDLVKNKPLTWLGSLPDSLRKVDKEDYQEILGEDITPESFTNFNCVPVAANARCFTTLAKFKSEPLDSCDKNLVNTKSRGTIGDYLCGQVRRWLKNDDDFKLNGRDNIKIPFYYSQCGEDWTPITDGEGTLYTDEVLCCTKDGLFRRCDGSGYKTECPDSDFTSSCVLIGKKFPITKTNVIKPSPFLGIPSPEACGRRCQQIVDPLYRTWTWESSAGADGNTCWCLNNIGTLQPQVLFSSGDSACPPG